MDIIGYKMDIDWDSVTDNEEVKGLLIQRIEIENKIKEIDDMALVRFEIESLYEADSGELKK